MTMLVKTLNRLTLKLSWGNTNMVTTGSSCHYFNFNTKIKHVCTMFITI